METMSKPFVVVVGVDFSERGEAALEQAFEFASLRPACELHIVHVMAVFAPSGELVTPAGAAPFSGATYMEVFEQLRAYSDQKFQAFETRQNESGHSGLLRAISHLRAGDVPSQEIAQLASDLEADLVVVGTHGRRGLSRLLLGSVAESLVRIAPCPVLVVRPRGEYGQEVPKIEPPCEECVKTRQATNGEELWCERHRERHGARHTYHQSDRRSDPTNFPLITH
jgi:nucleotide-binding universal stress UspA family protein